MLYKLCSDILAFFQTDNSKVSAGIWKWKVADPKMLDKVLSGWNLTYPSAVAKKTEEVQVFKMNLKLFCFLVPLMFDEGVEISI